ncbi:nuclear transport factor 2 family protein [Paenibacillus turicensis]|uniref:nuclear transport factor 2 family protein n=1 Tax=Paenibacillus turicensis TaxID=160487 RepID=UPI003D27B474
MTNTATAGNTTNSVNTDKNITMLNNYFRLFDASRTDDRAMQDLLSLFTEDVEVISNGNSRTGFDVVIKTIYEYNKDIKHMWDAWVLQPDGSYKTNWAVCGQAKDGTVFTKEGIDIMRLNEEGKIIYMKNVQTTEEAYSEYIS